ncbi:Somatomedin B domain [Cinara cedri]|uniref:Somatomedin B domain n=1 Tax=Cinara cedri TaxID=506608 RepID=A0A5E4N6W9_9HEMI|nr:Somatomedin B domain [Cinara cedri]
MSGHGDGGGRKPAAVLALATVLVAFARVPPAVAVDRDSAGPYCGKLGRCCEGRTDSCAVPIHRTTCYCDSFCYKRNSPPDCCPDFESFCNVTIPVYTTTDTNSITTTPRFDGPTTKVNCEDEATDLFLKCIGTTLKKFSISEMSDAKLRILQVINHYERTLSITSSCHA